MINGSNYAGCISSRCFTKGVRFSDLALRWSLYFLAACCLLISAFLFYPVLIAAIETFSASFFLSSPSRAGTSGGIFPIIVSTAWVIGIALTVAVPISVPAGIALALFLPDFAWYGRACRAALDLLSGIPSILFGMFGNALFCQWLGLGYSLLSGGLTLACMILPLIIRMTEDSFRSVPKIYLIQSEALQLSKLTTVLKVLLPLSAPAIIAGIMLSVARALSETAALLFTAGYSSRLPRSIFDSGRVISVHIYDLSMNVVGGEVMAYSSGATLLLLVTSISLVFGWMRNRMLARIHDRQ